MLYYIPSYSFSTHDELRTFQHRWHASDGQIYECDACRSTRPCSENYGQHWTRSNSHAQQLSAQQVSQLQKIDMTCIQHFMLCKRKLKTAQIQPPNPATALYNKHRFILEAGMEAIPQFLRFMFQNADELTLKLALHVCVSVGKLQQQHSTRRLLYQSSTLALRTHYDIVASVDMLLTMLLERIESQLCSAKEVVTTNRYEVKRMELNVQRIKWTEKQHHSKQHALPLQFSVKRACYNNAKLGTYRQNPETVESKQGLANYYAFQQCSNSGELFVVPFILQPTVQVSHKKLPNFVMTSDVSGAPRDLVRIRNLQKFLCHDKADSVISCAICGAKFMEQTQLMLHKLLDCGRHFSVLEMPEDQLEIYENCLPLKCEELDWPIFGIPEQRSVVQFL